MDREFNAWKRKNVTIRGIRDIYAEDNGGMAKYGKGLYSAFLGNMQMAKQYGKVYFLVNAIPKHPKVVNNTNDAEIFIYNLKDNFCKKNNPNYDAEAMDTRFFDTKTTIDKEMIASGYDGLVIKGREMVNYQPKDVKYYENLTQLYQYYELQKNKGLTENKEEKIKCKKCGWSWDKSDGGKDMYICHKCWNDNTPLVEKILREAITPTYKVFGEVNPHLYAFIQRDVTKFKTFEEKRKIVNTIEEYRAKSGKGLPLMDINPAMLVATQKSLEHSHIKSTENVTKPVFVVRLNGVYYIIDGHHRCANALKRGDRKITIALLNLDL